MGFRSVHMQSTLWLKCWSMEYKCKKCLLNVSFDGNCLFGKSLDNFISGGRSTKKENKTSVWEILYI